VRFILTLFVSFLLSGCVNSGFRNVLALDDFNMASFGPDAKIEVKRTEVILKVVAHKDKHSLNKAYWKYTKKYGKQVLGFALVHPSVDTCYVHTLVPEKWDNREALAIMGHEVYHCLLADHGAPTVPQ